MGKTKLGPIEIFGLVVLGVGLIHFILPIIVGVIFILLDYSLNSGIRIKTH